MCKGTKKSGIIQFQAQFSTEEKCLDHVFKLTNPNLSNCLKCGEDITYRRVLKRKCYQCPKCKHQLYPCAGTIFEKSTTPLNIWFHVAFSFVKSKNGLSAKEVERQTGVSYTTALRMLKLIRIMLGNDNDNFLSGTIELDETYIGGKNKNRHRDKKFQYSRGRSFQDKVPVFGLLERNGFVNAYVVPDTRAETLTPIIYSKINRTSTIMTDEYKAYSQIKKYYKHEIVSHGKGQYVKGDCWTNGLENFWSIVKRTINGSYVHVSRKYMQLYINECVFRYNHRNNKDILNIMFSLLALRVSLKPHQMLAL